MPRGSRAVVLGSRLVQYLTPTPNRTPRTREGCGTSVRSAGAGAPYMAMNKTLIGAFLLASACGGSGTPADGSADAGSASAESTGVGTTGDTTPSTTQSEASAEGTGDTTATMTSSNDEAPPPVGFDVAGLPDVPVSPCSEGDGGGGGGGGAETSRTSGSRTRTSRPRARSQDRYRHVVKRAAIKRTSGAIRRTSVNLEADARSPTATRHREVLAR